MSDSSPSPECATAAALNSVRAIFQRAEQDTQQQIQAVLNACRRDREADWQREEIRQLQRTIANLCRERYDLREANHAYARTLSDVRAALGAEDDADLVEEVRVQVALPRLLATIRAAGWLWEVGYCEHRGEALFYARVWLVNLDPLHYDEPAQEHYGYGESPEGALERAWKERDKHVQPTVS